VTTLLKIAPSEKNDEPENFQIQLLKEKSKPQTDYLFAPYSKTEIGSAKIWSDYGI
jgi:hypothetical protein